MNALQSHSSNNGVPSPSSLSTSVTATFSSILAAAAASASTPIAAHSSRDASSSSASASPSSSATPTPPVFLSSVELQKRSVALECWLQDALMRLYLQPDQSVGEIFCGPSGHAMSRLMIDLSSPPPTSSTVAPYENAFQLASYVGLDEETSNAKNRWITRDMPFPAEFIDTDVAQSLLFPPPAFATAASSSSPLAALSHLVSAVASSSSFTPCSLDCMFALKNCMNRVSSSRVALLTTLYNVSCSLKLNGYFLGTMIDPAVIWYKLMKRERESGGKPMTERELASAAKLGIQVSSPGYKLDYPYLKRTGAKMEMYTKEMKGYFQFVDAQQQQQQSHKPHQPPAASVSISSYLLHSATFIEEARLMGLELVSMQNCYDFYQEYSQVDVLSETFRSLHIFSKYSPNTLTPQQIDLCSLQTQFAFRKIAEPQYEALTKAREDALAKRYLQQQKLATEEKSGGEAQQQRDVRMQID